MPIKSILPTAKVYLQQQASAYEMENLERCFDDLRTTKGLAEAYLQNENGTHDDVEDFLSQVNQIYKEFLGAISSMNKREGPVKMKACVKTYVDAFNGRDINGKFSKEWRNILSKKVSKIKLECLSDEKCQFYLGYLFTELCSGFLDIFGLLFRLNISRKAKLNSLLFLVALRDSVRSQVKIVVAVRKTFGTTIKLHLGLGSVDFSLVKSIFTGVPQGKIDRRCAPSEVMTIQKLIIRMCRIRTTSL